MVHGVFRGHGPSVFTHAYLEACNMRVRPDGTVALLDWEYSGWYPVCWEASLNVIWRDKEDGFHRYLRRYLDEYPAQVGWLLHYRMWLLFAGLNV
jgi:thiamine kinase-like enzyme